MLCRRSFTSCFPDDAVTLPPESTQNPYAPPGASPLGASPAGGGSPAPAWQGETLYNPAQVAIGTFIGGPLAGTALLALN